jgi:hypothetical protein
MAQALVLTPQQSAMALLLHLLVASLRTHIFKVGSANKAKSKPNQSPIPSSLYYYSGVPALLPCPVRQPEAIHDPRPFPVKH